jgi:hypothetical protein
VNARILPHVVNVRVKSDRDDSRRTIMLATETARPGGLVRLTVGTNYPPPWTWHSLRPDLRYQVVAESSSVAEAWQRELEAIK